MTCHEPFGSHLVETDFQHSIICHFRDSQNSAVPKGCMAHPFSHMEFFRLCLVFLWFRRCHLPLQRNRLHGFQLVCGNSTARLPLRRLPVDLCQELGRQIAHGHTEQHSARSGSQRQLFLGTGKCHIRQAAFLFQIFPGIQAAVSRENALLHSHQKDVLKE